MYITFILKSKLVQLIMIILLRENKFLQNLLRSDCQFYFPCSSSMESIYILSAP